ncbi:head maturation protease, ClpP-related [Fodinicurvata sp. EGI_FJ10296]|uniref:head maturation protease, ClpP-related n=1 Tax=Fodinicurvata sp. EGI_FJ10296 TaxID=3231908 RepID=UPI00345139E0
MPILTDGNELALVGPVAMEGGFAAADVIAALATIGRDSDIAVRLNSGGGLATEGAAIHAALSAHRGQVAVTVEGVAASAASLIAIAGDSVAMARGAVMMIHDPAAVTIGTAADHTRSVAGLERLSAAYAQLYADRTGKAADAMRTLMQAETWMTADEAVAAGFADSVLGDDASDPEPTAFAYGLYARPPERVMTAAVATPDRSPGTAPASSPSSSAPVSDPCTPASGADAGAIAQLCAEAGEPSTMVARLLSEGASVATARARLAAAATIRERVTAARRLTASIADTFADDAVARGLSPDEVSTALLARLTTDPLPTIDSHPPDRSPPATARLDHTAIFDRMNRIKG